MKNWTIGKSQIAKKLKNHLSLKTLKIICNLPDLNWLTIKELKEQSKYLLNISENELTACPDELEISLLQLAFSDLFFIEEFDELQKGLSKLSLLCGSKSFLRDKKRVNDFFSNSKNRSLGSGASTRFPLLLKNLKEVKFCKTAFFELKHFSPSLMSLSIIIKPSFEFESIFNSIIKRNCHSEISIKFLKLCQGIIEYSRKPPVFTRQSEIDKLFFKINKEIVKLLKKYIGVGLSKYGTLPCIEVFSINKPISIFNGNNYKSATASPILQDGFWRGLGIPYFESGLDIKNWSTMFKNEREKQYNLISYQALLSMEDYKKEKNKQGNNIKDSFAHNFSYFLFELCPLLSIEHFIKNLEREIFKTRDIIIPQLSKQLRGKVKIKSLKRGIKRIVIINGLCFQQERIKAEINERFTKSYLIREIKGIKSKNSNQDFDFADSLYWHINNSLTFNDNCLNTLKTSFNNLLAYKTAQINHRIQITLLLLTFLAVVLVFVPEEARNKIYSFIKLFLWK